MNYNIVIFNPELKYQKNREEIFLSLHKYDKNKYLYFSIEILENKLNENKYDDLIELLISIDSNITKNNINHIIFYPRQLKFLNPNNLLHKLIINCNIKKSIFIDDIHCLELSLEIINKFDNKILSYAYLINIFLKGLNENIISLPHYLNDRFVYKNESKDIQISILGHYQSETYLTRKHIIQNIKNINNQLINCSIKCFPKLNNIIYYQTLKKSYASIATTGDNPTHYYPYIVSKYFEIPGCNSLLIAHILPEMEDEFKKYGFIENENYIKFSSIKELIEKCNFIFDPKNKEYIEKIRNNGYQLVINNHLISHRLKSLVKMLNSN